jgi:hypothetical protein
MDVSKQHGDGPEDRREFFRRRGELLVLVRRAGRKAGGFELLFFTLPAGRKSSCRVRASFTLVQFP